jgi:lipopolysaccharide/colanic/teichoic acid biosynthesis glycosyltransferase
MFLLYVSDIGEGVNSEVKLFADDGLLYRTIGSESDTKQLQEDLSKMTEWSKKWLMRFNATMYLLVFSCLVFLICLLWWSVVEFHMSGLI